MDKMCRNQVHIKHSHAHKIAIEDEHFKLLFSYFMFKLFCLCDRYSQRHLLPALKYIRLECVKFVQNWIKLYLCLVKQKAFVFWAIFMFWFCECSKANNKMHFHIGIRLNSLTKLYSFSLEVNVLFRLFDVDFFLNSFVYARAKHQKYN